MADALEKEQILKRLKRRHPIYERNKMLWGEIHDVVHDGVRTNMDSYLPKTAGEDDTEYEARKTFARFKADIPTHIQRLVGAATKQQPKRPDGWDRFKEFSSNVDGCGTSLDDHDEDQMTRALYFGAAFAIVDRPTVDADISQVVTKTSMGFMEQDVTRDIADNDLVIKSYSIRQIVDWDIDDRGEPNWIRLLEATREAATPDTEPQDVELYTELDRSSWRRFRVFAVRGVKQVEEVGKGDHNLGIVPIAWMWLFRGQEHWSFESVIRYAYHTDIEAFQSDADRRYNSWKHAQGTINDDRQNASKVQVQTGPSAVNRIQAGQEAGPQYVSLPPEVIEIHEKNELIARQAGKRILGIDPLGGTEDPNAMQASGRSRVVSFTISEERILRRMAKAAERYEKRIFELAMRWNDTRDNIPSHEILNTESSTWPKTFNFMATDERIGHWQETRTGINSDTYDRELQKEIVASVLGTVSAEVIEAINEEIDTNDLINKNPLELTGLGDPDAQTDPSAASDTMRELDDLTEADMEDDEEPADGQDA